MSKTQNSIKKIEKQFASNVTHGFGHFFRMVGNLFVRVFKVFDSKLTVMIVPHSQGKVINFQTNVFALVLGFLVAAGVITSFFFYNNHALSTSREISALTEQNRYARKSG